MTNRAPHLRYRAFGPRLLVVTAITLVAAGGGIDRAAHGQRLVLDSVRLGNGGVPFVGDGPMLTTISPNGDGYRDRAGVSFHLSRRALVRLQVRESMNRDQPPKLIWRKRRWLRAGEHRLYWRPPAWIEPRTYQLQLVIPGVRTPAGVVRVLGIDAGFKRDSYGAGQGAPLSLATDARALTLHFMQAGPEHEPNLFDYGNDAMHGVPAGRAWTIHWKRTARRGALRLRIPRGQSGLYFLRLQGRDGRTGFAPFVLLPRRFGTHRIAVVFPTHTWEAYNHRDVDGNGWGDTWYEVNSINTVDLTRPLLHHGVPTRFRGYEAGFVRWLYETGKQVDFITDSELDRLSGGRLARDYDLIVFLGHHEYMTSHAYDAATRYRNLGGNLMFTATTNFLYRIVRHGRFMVRTQQFRKLGRPEAALIGVQYLHNDGRKHMGRYEVVGQSRAPWAFAGTGLHDGDHFGMGGIEVDARTAESPPNTIVLARMPNLQGPGLSAEMTYYTTHSGAKVFAPGALNFSGTAMWPSMAIFFENVWDQLARP